MYFWILWALLVSLWDITYKKSIVISWKKLSDDWYQFLSWIVSLIVTSIVYLSAIIFSFQELPEFFSIKSLLIFLVVWIISVIWDYLLAYAFKNEKISVLTPYEEFETIFTVIFGFLFFSWVSITSFICVLIAWTVLTIWSIDFKKFKFNKYALIVTIWSLLFALKSNLLAYLLIDIAFSPLDSIFYSSIFAFLVALIIILIKKEFSKSFKKSNNKIFLFISTENIIRFLVWFVYAYLINDVWIVQTTLLWLLTVFSNMAFAYLVFKEVPAKKDYIVAFFVILCIVWWTSLG